MTPDEARKALAAVSGRPGRPASLTPEEATRRVRLRTKAAHDARTVLVRLHPDEYQMLYRTACADVGLHDDGEAGT